jgi:hypothetical protein
VPERAEAGVPAGPIGCAFERFDELRLGRREIAALHGGFGCIGELLRAIASEQTLQERHSADRVRAGVTRGVRCHGGIMTIECCWRRGTKLP